MDSGETHRTLSVNGLSAFWMLPSSLRSSVGRSTAMKSRITFSSARAGPYPAQLAMPASGLFHGRLGTETDGAPFPPELLQRHERYPRVFPWCRRPDRQYP